MTAASPDEHVPRHDRGERTAGPAGARKRIENTANGGSKTRWIWFGIALLLVTIAVWASFLILRPTVLRIATGPATTDEARMLAAFAADLRSERAATRLELSEHPDLRQAAAALQSGRADLVVVRPDLALPANGQTVAILRETGVLLLLRADSDVEAVDQIELRKLAVLTAPASDLALIAHLLRALEKAPEGQAAPTLTDADALAALAAQRLDAVVATVSMADAASVAHIRTLLRSRRTPLKAIGVTLTPALAAQNAAWHEVDIPAGALGGNPRQPAESLKTTGFGVRLMAASDLGGSAVAEFTRSLFKARARLVRVAPSAASLKGFDVDVANVAILPAHPGAVEYFAREQKTFFERYGDWLYLALFAGGGAASLMGWVRQRVSRRRREFVDDILDELLSLLELARTAKSQEELDGVAREIDSLVTRAVMQTRRQTFNTRTMGALMLGMDSARAAISDRRATLFQQALGPGGARNGATEKVG